MKKIDEYLNDPAKIYIKTLYGEIIITISLAVGLELQIGNKFIAGDMKPKWFGDVKPWNSVKNDNDIWNLIKNVYITITDKIIDNYTLVLTGENESFSKAANDKLNIYMKTHMNGIDETSATLKGCVSPNISEIQDKCRHINSNGLKFVESSIAKMQNLVYYTYSCSICRKEFYTINPNYIEQSRIPECQHTMVGLSRYILFDRTSTGCFYKCSKCDHIIKCEISTNLKSDNKKTSNNNSTDCTIKQIDDTIKQIQDNCKHMHDDGTDGLQYWKSEVSTVYNNDQYGIVFDIYSCNICRKEFEFINLNALETTDPSILIARKICTHKTLSNTTLYHHIGNTKTERILRCLSCGNISKAKIGEVSPHECDHVYPDGTSAIQFLPTSQETFTHCKICNLWQIIG